MKLRLAELPLPLLIVFWIIMIAAALYTGPLVAKALWHTFKKLAEME
jgi:hypothetical protein